MITRIYLIVVSLLTFLLCSFDNKLQSQDFYSLDELYVYGRLSYNFYEGADLNLGMNFRVPLTDRIKFPLQVELNYFREGLNLFGKTVGVSGVGLSLNSYYAFMDLGRMTGITILDYVGLIGGISTVYEYYSPSEYLKAPELAPDSDNLSWGINLAPIVKIKFSDKVAGFFQYTMYLLPTSPFGVFRNSLGIGVQYNL